MNLKLGSNKSKIEADRLGTGEESLNSARSNSKISKLIGMTNQQVQNMILKHGKYMDAIEMRKPKDPVEIEMPKMEELQLKVSDTTEQKIKNMEFENELTLENREKMNVLKRVRKDLEANMEFYRYQKFRKLGVPEEDIAIAIYEEDKLLQEQTEDLTVDEEDENEE